MKKSLGLLVIAIFTFTSVVQAQFWGNKKIKGNGNMTLISRSTGDYDIIDCAGSMDFILVKGTEGNIKIEGEENLLEYIITEVHGGKLKVKVENGINLRPSSNKDLKITIPFIDIKKVSLSGSGDIYNTDSIKEDNFTVSVAGSGDMKLSVETERLESSVTGSGNIILNGNTEFLITKVTGSGDFKGFDLQAKHTEAYVTGSGGIDVNCTQYLKARVTGSGDIKYRGNPEQEDTKVTGSGSIRN